MTNLINKAKDFAILKHQEQKYGNYPYSYHLDEVYKLVYESGLGIDCQIGAYLHDVLEDTVTTEKELKEKFGEEISKMVFCVSGFGKNRKERTQNIIDKLTQNPQYIDLKLCDRIVNMRQSKLTNSKLYEMYCKELPQFEPLISLGSICLQKIIANEFKNLHIQAVKLSPSVRVLHRK